MSVNGPLAAVNVNTQAKTFNVTVIILEESKAVNLLKLHSWEHTEKNLIIKEVIISLRQMCYETLQNLYLLVLQPHF